jgi:cytochrome c oxidase subunit I
MSTAAIDLPESKPSGLLDWLTTVDHKKIGVLYVGMAIVFVLIAGLEALLIRWQLFYAQNNVLDPDTFNQMFTMHGTTMVFFFGMPILAGIANFAVPLQIGARDMAFPRLNALGFWATLLGGILAYCSFLTGGAPAIGWFAYAPLTEHNFARSAAVDFWALGLLVSGVGSLTGAINLVATVIALRAPGMTLRKLPLYTWMALWANILIILALPPFTASLIMLLFDRNLGAHFFDTQGGGSAYLWQHLFWFFGHPEVYILVLPAFGMISEVIPTFSRKVIFGYEFVAASTIAIGFISFGVWAHHMFTVGMSRQLDLFFSASSLLISIPTGVKVFNWLATMYGGRLDLRAPMLFALGFMALFVLGGLTGIMLGVMPVDWQLSDSYFVVGHFHWVLIGGTVFGVFAGLYYWYPKATGRLMSERLARWQFWLLFIGFVSTFGAQHWLGIQGMPRRIYTYQPDRGWDIWNQVATAGAVLQAASFLFFGVNVVWSWKHGELAGDDPWGAWTLEWATTSPPPSYNFEAVPEVKSRRPLWDLKHPDDPDWKYEDELPEGQAARAAEETVAPGPRPTPLQSGIAAFLASEVAFFGTLLMAYVYFLRQTTHGSPSPREVFWLPQVLFSTLCLVSSSVTIHFAEKALHAGARTRFFALWTATIVLGALFLAGTALEWADLIGSQGLTIATNMFGTTYFTLVGFHALHVTMGLVALSVVLALGERGVVNPASVQVVSWYWHFVDAVWVVVFTLVYIVGR